MLKVMRLGGSLLFPKSCWEGSLPHPPAWWDGCAGGVDGGWRRARQRALSSPEHELEGDSQPCRHWPRSSHLESPAAPSPSLCEGPGPELGEAAGPAPY